MATVNPVPSETSGEEALRPGVVGEYGYSLQSCFTLCIFFLFFITTAICIKT